MKLVRRPVEQIRPGDKVTTENWSLSSDGAEFTVLQMYQDGWLLCLNGEGKRRQFAIENVKKL
jgi:hypothetical protein